MTLLTLLLGILSVLLIFLLLLRYFDHGAEVREWQRLLSKQPEHPARFDPAMTAELPEAARRYFAYTIAPGTPLLRVAEIDMKGLFSLKPPEYLPMEARQILALPHGFVWKMRLVGGLPVSGSDTGSWTRFRILGLFPVARAGGDTDHTRSAFGRYVIEAVFWTPAALLPGEGIAWEAVSASVARVTVTRGELSQSVDITLGHDGQPIEVSMMRWSNANPQKQYRLQPFGGTLSDFRDVSGYRLPFRVEGGNLFGTGGYFPFYKAEITAIRFPLHTTLKN
ncbi:hypothetical protein LOH54_09485 [Sulfurimonas sp. HSL-3221]|uniref:DUF6544 family protein n=1 Tax=Thiomicrolovo sulfuroxydans TaxID=2894755 RepID=UPI001E5DA480|nr:DUF6544 family protein [Sulfurimonas sp. HSL-3221]UFS61886.1 hypothetical protein LOH54_09485 [Sulfurimonas sp. HSL-3221]